MKKGFLAQEIDRAAGSLRKRLIICVIAISVIYLFFYGFATVDSEVAGAIAEFSLFFYGAGGVVALSVLVSLFKVMMLTSRSDKYTFLTVHDNETDRVSAGRAIDSEAAQGKVLVDAYDDSSGPKGHRFVLFPSYLLLAQGFKLTAIPVGKILWVCSQTGRKGGSFIVQLKIVTASKIYNLTGGHIPHYQQIADRLNQYIPNVFYAYDPFELSYDIDELFAKDRERFFAFYQECRQVYDDAGQGQA